MCHFSLAGNAFSLDCRSSFCCFYSSESPLISGLSSHRLHLIASDLNQGQGKSRSPQWFNHPTSRNSSDFWDQIVAYAWWSLSPDRAARRSQMASSGLSGCHQSARHWPLQGCGSWMGIWPSPYQRRYWVLWWTLAKWFLGTFDSGQSNLSCPYPSSPPSPLSDLS